MWKNIFCRTYKLGCDMHIMLSVSRADNKLVVRKSYLKHSHACTSNTYSTYPESRRLTQDEKEMAKVLLDLKVPSHIVKVC